MNSIGEVVKQFEFDVPSLEPSIKGKIVKSLAPDGTARYTWSISHHYKPTAGAGVHYPGRVTLPSLEEAEALFRAYGESFVTDFEVCPNKNF